MKYRSFPCTFFFFCHQRFWNSQRYYSHYVPPHLFISKFRLICSSPLQIQIPLLERDITDVVTDCDLTNCLDFFLQCLFCSLQFCGAPEMPWICLVHLPRRRQGRRCWRKLLPFQIVLFTQLFSELTDSPNMCLCQLWKMELNHSINKALKSL